MSLKFCPKCRKVFWVVKTIESTWCPNCMEWRIHNWDQDRLVRDSMADIKMEYVPLNEVWEMIR